MGQNFDEAWRLASRSSTKPQNQRLDVAVIALARGDRARFRREMQTPIIISNRGARFPRLLEAYARGLEAEVGGRRDEALGWFKQAIGHAPIQWHFPTFEDCFAEALFRYGRLDEAEAEYRRLLTLNPAAARSQFRLAQIAEKRNQPAEAEAGYRRFLALWSKADADAPEIVAARKWLAARPRATATAASH
jgi:tetratricopeptide (TPR) repeat protein